jgi:dTDP-4-amino-4,6-dideoxygalactose transaminase
MKKIQLLVPSMPNASQLASYLEEIDRNRHYTNFGPLNKKLENRVRGELESESGQHCVVTTVSNCTVGIELALQASGLKPGSRVLMPTLTFVATATAIVRVGMVPIFADVDPVTWALSPEIAARHLHSVDAVLPVSTFGYAHDVSAWDAFAIDAGKPVIIDSAGAYGNQKAGKNIDIVFSFHATKSFGAGEGGVVVSPSEDRIARIRRLANFGIDTSIGQIVEVGTNGKMSEYHCAVGLAMYDMWGEIKNARRRLMNLYISTLSRRCPQVVFQEKAADGIYPLLPVLLPPGVTASDVAVQMASLSIETRRWYCPPVHTHPAMQQYDTAGCMDVANDIGNRILGLPFHLELSEADMEYVVDSLGKILSSRECIA